MKRSRNVASPYSSASRTKKRPKNDVSTPEYLQITPNLENANSPRTYGGISKCLLTPCRRMGLGRNRKNPLNKSIDDSKSPLLVTKKTEADKNDVEEKNEESNAVTSNNIIVSSQENGNKKIKKNSSQSSIELYTIVNKINKVTVDSNLDREIETIDVEVSNTLNKVVNKNVKNTVMPKIVDEFKSDKKKKEITSADLKDSEINLLKSCMEVVNKKVGPKNKDKSTKNKKLSLKVSPKVAQSKKRSEIPLAQLKENIINEKSRKDSSLMEKTNDVSLVQLKENVNKHNVKDNMSVRKNIITSQANSASSYLSDGDDDSDDSVFEIRKIRDRKSYNKHAVKIDNQLPKNDPALEKEIDEIKSRIAEKKKKLENFNNREQGGKSVEELETLIINWRKTCQQALNQLLDVSLERGKLKENVDMEQLLKMMQIPADLVHYDANNMTFK